MRFYILSDLHLRAEVEAYKTSDRIKRLCSKIRQAADIGENILFIIEEIKYARKSSFDMPKTLLETKEFLGEVRKYY